MLDVVAEEKQACEAAICALVPVGDVRDAGRSGRGRGRSRGGGGGSGSGRLQGVQGKTDDGSLVAQSK